MKTTVIHHSADYDGIFSREIARKFIPDATLIGWDFLDNPLKFPREGTVYVIDLPVDRVFGCNYEKTGLNESHFTKDAFDRVVWIDHHKSSIDTHPKDIPGYRIDGVAACRLAWQWFAVHEHNAQHWKNEQMQIPLPTKEMFVDRKVPEPLAVRLAGEFDVWDHRDNDADVAFQFGLDAQDQIDWNRLLALPEKPSEKEIQQMIDVGHPLDLNPDGTVDVSKGYCDGIVNAGRYAMRCYAKRDADVIRTRSFISQFEGLTFLCLNTPRCNSNTFAALDVPSTGHDALLAFFFNGTDWNVSMYHAAHRKDLDLSEIAKRHGGGGHRGACGFRAKGLPFIPS